MATEFEQFVSHQDDRIYVNLATGHQLLGASTVMGRSVSQSQVPGTAAFNKTVALSPDDPTAYNLWALANIALENNVALAAKDLKTCAWWNKPRQQETPPQPVIAPKQGR